MATATQFAQPDVSADSKIRKYITEQVTLRSQPAKLRKLFLKLGRDHRGRFDFTTFRTALLKIGCRTDVIDMENKAALKRVFDSCASDGRMSWKDFAGKLIIGSTSGLAETFTGRLQYGAGSQREIRRMDYRIKHQSEIRAGGAKFFEKIFLHRVLQRAFTHPRLELLLRKNDKDKDGKLTMDELHRSLIDIGVHDCSRSDVLEFAKSLSDDGGTGSAVLVSISKLVNLCFEDPTKRPGAGAVFFSGGGSRSHERDCSVQPRGIHHAIDVVRQKICQLPGMDTENGISSFFDSIDPTGDGEVSKSALELALKNRLKITSKVLHSKDVRGMFEFLDKDNSSGVDRNEFIGVFGRDANERKMAADATLAGNKHTTCVGMDAERKKRERARDQLLSHVRERVSLLCRERGLKELWITKMCRGQRKGRLNSAGFKAGLKRLGCRGFGPGDADLLFDFCVSQSPDTDRKNDIGFTSFSRVFSPDTFFTVETADKQLEKNQKRGIGILPTDPVVVRTSSVLNSMNPASDTEVGKEYEITTNKMERIVKEKAWNLARSTAMGNSAITNPNNLVTIMRRYTSNPQIITPKEFLRAARDING
jgi:Ca2+-binding EF-hand superfamily protein